MHNNYFFFRTLTPALENRIKSCVVSECFSQEKDELVIRFETSAEPFFIKAAVSPSFACVSFPGTYHRARKNSADLFNALIGLRVQGIRQFRNERSFAITFSDSFYFLFKMHGNRSNLILFQNGIVKEMLNNTLEQDWELTMDHLDREIDWSYETFVEQQENLRTQYFTFGKVVWSYLTERSFFSLKNDAQWAMLQELLQTLDHPRFYTCEVAGKLAFSLLPFGKIIREHPQDPLQAITGFFVAYTRRDTFSDERAAALSIVKQHLQASENYLAKTTANLATIQTGNNYKTWADVLMANIHAVAAGQDRVTLPDFYDDGNPIEIKLRKEFSVQKNAAVYYQKSKKQQAEIARLQKVLQEKTAEILDWKEKFLRIESSETLKDLRAVVDLLNLVSRQEKQLTALPYHEYEYFGYKVLVGKNAVGNDTLTQKYGYKEDLWLHAKDVSGSHVLIKYQAGKKFPKEVIERAAELAAYHSKRKTDTLCPVVFTPRKYVRKRKGDPAGAVVVDREEVILVTPTR